MESQHAPEDVFLEVLIRHLVCVQVRPDSLFQLFGGGSAVLAALVLREVQRGALRLDAPVAATWADFGTAGKADLTLAQLLNHQTGLSGAVPARAALSELCGLDAMVAHVAAAAADEEEAADARSGNAFHEGLPWGWALAGALQARSHRAFTPPPRGAASVPHPHR